MFRLIIPFAIGVVILQASYSYLLNNTYVLGDTYVGYFNADSELNAPRESGYYGLMKCVAYILLVLFNSLFKYDFEVGRKISYLNIMVLFGCVMFYASTTTMNIFSRLSDTFLIYGCVLICYLLDMVRQRNILIMLKFCFYIFGMINLVYLMYTNTCEVMPYYFII